MLQVKHCYFHFILLIGGVLHLHHQQMRSGSTGQEHHRRGAVYVRRSMTIELKRSRGARRGDRDPAFHAEEVRHSAGLQLKPARKRSGEMQHTPRTAAKNAPRRACQAERGLVVEEGGGAERGRGSRPSAPNSLDGGRGVQLRDKYAAVLADLDRGVGGPAAVGDYVMQAVLAGGGIPDVVNRARHQIAGTKRDAMSLCVIKSNRQ